MTRKLLPIGIQTFSRMREDGAYYVDKTRLLLSLIRGGSRYFLSRPRRFGKSLLVSTLKELFEGNEALFEGLAIHKTWDWSRRCPVVRLDFSTGGFEKPMRVDRDIQEQLQGIEADAGIAYGDGDAPLRFRHLIRKLRRETGERVVVLVDEYDKPILDALHIPPVACANRDLLRELYATIKASDEDIRFAFLTGVSKFSKVNLFSGLNNLDDITLDPRYSSLCGYTDEDIDTVFAPELEGLDRARIREWYNGYSWLGEEKVYNPFDVLLLFSKREFGAWWFQTGTPDFLLRTMVRRGLSSVKLEGMLASAALLDAFDVEHIATEALLFQTGYLTILGKESRHGNVFYRLGYPNREVRQSLNDSLLEYLTRGASGSMTEHRLRLLDILEANDFARLKDLFHAFFASIPCERYTHACPRMGESGNDIARFEGFYASVVHSYFTGAGFDLVVEDSSSHARLDMAVCFNRNVYLFEFKVVEHAGEGAAMAQLRERRYADKYRARGSRSTSSRSSSARTSATWSGSRWRPRESRSVCAVRRKEQATLAAVTESRP